MPKDAIDHSIKHGEIVYWNDEKGFGFIHVSGEKRDIFFHASSFAYHHRRPEKGLLVSFILETSNKRKPSAVRTVLQGHEGALFSDQAHDQHALSQPHIFEAIICALMSCFFFVVIAIYSLPLTISSFIISCITFTLYSIDKRASLNHTRRVPEAVLYLSTLLGGWPGGIIARPLLRHKTTKKRFISFFWMSAVINIFCLYFIICHLPKSLL